MAVSVITVYIILNISIIHPLGNSEVLLLALFSLSLLFSFSSLLSFSPFHLLFFRILIASHCFHRNPCHFSYFRVIAWCIQLDMRWFQLTKTDLNWLEKNLVCCLSVITVHIISILKVKYCIIVQKLIELHSCKIAIETLIPISILICIIILIKRSATSVTKERILKEIMEIMSSPYSFRSFSQLHHFEVNEK